MAALHCLQDVCTDAQDCPCPCEDCFYVREHAYTGASATPPTIVSSIEGAPPGIRMTLAQLTKKAWRDRLEADVRIMATEVAGTEPDVSGRMRALVHRMRALVHEMRRRVAIYETVSPFSADPIDADDACSFVAAAALSIGIHCRFVVARFKRSWTCWVAYRDKDRWRLLDCQTGAERLFSDPDEIVVGELPGAS
jgi:hypothetical protein